MDRFEGRVAVVTGGGTGMGRELVRQLAAAGAHVAMCDVSADNMAESQALAESGAASGVRITSFVADVADEASVLEFRADVAARHGSQLHLLFNNAGIGGGGSFVLDDRGEWEKTFDVCWGGVYICTRAFMPMLLDADAGHVVNTSSVNGFWASLGPSIPHTAYSAAKFAVKGFTEALINDFRMNAPHLSASVVMPGHVGTSIVINSQKAFGRDPKELTQEQIVEMRERLAKRGMDLSTASDEDIRIGLQFQAEQFRDAAPLSASDAATIILAGVLAGEWRILVGDDALALDELIRANPEEAYDDRLVERLRARGMFGFAL